MCFLNIRRILSFFSSGLRGDSIDRETAAEIGSGVLMDCLMRMSRRSPFALMNHERCRSWTIGRGRCTSRPIEGRRGGGLTERSGGRGLWPLIPMIGIGFLQLRPVEASTWGCVARTRSDGGRGVDFA